MRCARVALLAPTRCFMLVIGMIACSMAMASPPVAIVTELSGQAWLGRASAQPVALAMGIAEGAEINLAPGARVVLAYPTRGDVYELNGTGHYAVRIDRVQALGKAEVSKRVMNRELTALAVKPEAGVQGSLLMRGGESASITLPSPRRTVLADDARRFEWIAEGSAAYRFLLSDEQGRVVYSAEAASSSLQLPAELVLHDGEQYIWQVKTLDAKGEALVVSCQFSILPRAESDTIAAARPAAAADRGEKLLYAIALEQRGLHQRALSEWNELGARASAAPATR